MLTFVGIFTREGEDPVKCSDEFVVHWRGVGGEVESWEGGGGIYCTEAHALASV